MKYWKYFTKSQNFIPNYVLYRISPLAIQFPMIDWKVIWFSDRLPTLEDRLIILPQIGCVSSYFLACFGLITDTLPVLYETIFKLLYRKYKIWLRVNINSVFNINSREAYLNCNSGTWNYMSPFCSGRTDSDWRVVVSSHYSLHITVMVLLWCTVRLDINSIVVEHYDLPVSNVTNSCEKVWKKKKNLE